MSIAMYLSRFTGITDSDLALQCASQLERMGHPRFSTYDMDHDGGDPAVLAGGRLYSVDEVYREMIIAKTTEEYLLCTETLDCY